MYNRDMYTYKAHVVSVYDGDTVTVDIDLGFDVHLRGLKVRLYGINAPELKGSTRSQGLISRDALRSRVLDKDITIKTLEDRQEKYGRWLGILTVDGEEINTWMVRNYYAVSYMDDVT